MDSATKNRQSYKDIHKMVQRAFGNHLKSDEIKLKELTEGFYNAAYEITMPDKAVILKIAPPADARIMSYEKNIMKAEVDGLTIIREQTAVPVPQVYYYDDTKELCDASYFFMEKLEGDSYFTLKKSTAPEERQLLQVETGRLNAAMNAVTGTLFGYIGLPKMQGVSWKDTFLSMIYGVLEDGISIDINLGNGVEYDSVRELINQADYILEEVKLPSFVHWDLWDGNIFVKDNKITGLIDFERALWGDPLMEYSFRRHSYNEEFIRGYGADLRAAAPVRALLYDMYLYLIMVIETKYRNYPDDWQYQFASQNLRYAIDDLRKRV